MVVTCECNAAGVPRVGRQQADEPSRGGLAAAVLWLPPATPVVALMCFMIVVIATGVAGAGLSPIFGKASCFPL